MKVVDSEKAIALLEKAKRLLPGNDGTLPPKLLSQSGMDVIIQGLRDNSVDLNILTKMVGLAGKKKKSDTLLVGFDHSQGDIAVLIIGRKEPGGKVQIVNQFQGKAAEELYKKLAEKPSTPIIVSPKESGSDQFQSPEFRPDTTRIFSRKGHPMLPTDLK